MLSKIPASLQRRPSSDGTNMTSRPQTAAQNFTRAREPVSPLDIGALRVAYRRWASVYDVGFGLVSGMARRAAVAEVNQDGGRRVLEVGVGTGLALPSYTPDKVVTGIDLSGDMLARARSRIAATPMPWVSELREMDAEEMDFTDGTFDVAVAMFVASVVPNPRRLLAEMRRVVRPGGRIILVNHFARDAGLLGFAEKIAAPASRTLGWHPDFRIDSMLTKADIAQATIRSLAPLGIFTLVSLENTASRTAVLAA